ncbi:EF-P 5-aminopentanol modification-associated protein YfmF [Paenibacillus koleovorans]|uniref:EF-P 5-aminopentanol modification-associated protein YfmF n=1 Tax=Paenibacillus koleovorans TaxID=121608 RepID=UPI001FE79990|nr:pitrilysin family protein [Paenibacillus koleovorans]
MTNASLFERDEVNRIRLHVKPTKQFKTFAISVYIGQPLSEQTVTSTALIPFVMRRGTSALPETKQFREKLDDLYGAGFGFDVYKRGDYQIVQFRMDVIHDQFVAGAEGLLRQGFEFVGSTIADPLVENGAFREKYVTSEKDTLKKKLESIINDKIRYAAERCTEEMCSGEPYRLYPLGRLEDLPSIDPASLYSSYNNWLAEAPIDIYVVGDTTMDEVKRLVTAAFKIDRQGAARYDKKVVHPQARATKEIVERLDVSQGKLNMGLRLPITYVDEQYPAALVYNGILGGYPHSKLFINVREKASLAYYASSRLDGHKGILTLQSGIEIANFEKAKDIMQQQLEAMVQGDISDLELSQTKAMIANQLRESKDSAFETIGLDFNAQLSGRDRSVEQLIAATEAVDVAAIKQVAEQVRLDTIYFLRDRKGGQ